MGITIISFLFVFNRHASAVKVGAFILRKSANDGGIAQLVEHLPCKQGVIGSNPITSTTCGLIAQLVRAHA